MVYQEDDRTSTHLFAGGTKSFQSAETRNQGRVSREAVRTAMQGLRLR